MVVKEAVKKRARFSFFKQEALKTFKRGREKRVRFSFKRRPRKTFKIDVNVGFKTFKEAVKNVDKRP